MALRSRQHDRAVPRRLAAALVGCVLGASACLPAAPSAGSPGQVAPTAVRSGGRVVLGSVPDVIGLNPLLWTDPRSQSASKHLYESMVIHDPQTGEPISRLAESWSLAADATSITFTLRPNLMWSDGSPLTGNDVVFTVMALLRSKTAPTKGDLLDVVDGGRAFAEGRATSVTGLSTDGRTVTAHFAQPQCTALKDLGELPILPRAVFGKYLDPADPSKTIDDAPENNEPPLSSGPFMFKEWVPRDHVTLVRNDRFFLGPPRLDEWVWRVVPNPQALVAALETGEVDMGSVAPQVVEELDASGSVEVLSTPGTGYHYIGWNELRGGKEYFQERAVRQALSYAVNWNQMIATLLDGHGQRALAHTPPASWAYDGSGLNDYAYDPQHARALLEQAGWRSGPDGIYARGDTRLAFTLVTQAGNLLAESMLQAVAEQYRQAGVDVTPRTEATEALLQRVIRSKDPTYGDQGGHDYDAALFWWGQLLSEPDANFYWHSSSIMGGSGNRVGYRNAIVDQAIEDGRTHCAPADRKAAYDRMNQQLNLDAPVSFGLIADDLLAVSKQVHGVAPGPFSHLAQWNVEQWWRDQ